MKLSKRTIITAVAVLLIGGGVFAATRKPKTTYETEKVDRGTVVEEVSVTGSVSSMRNISLVPEVSARVTKLNVDEGSEVKEGDVLVELDSRDTYARLASQRASVDAAYARLAELIAGATPQELASAQAAVATAESKRDAAVAAKADAERNVANVRAKTETVMAGKLQAFLLAYDAAQIDARDAMERLTSALFNASTDQVTISTINAAAQTEAKSTRTLAKSKFADLEASIASAKAGGDAAAALAAYPSVNADLATIVTHLVAVREMLNYTSGVSSSALAAYQADASIALNSVSSAMSALSASKSDVELQNRLNITETSNAASALTDATFVAETSGKALLQAQADLNLKTIGNRKEVIAAQRAQVSAAEATLASLQTELSKRKLVAPIDGIVTSVAVEIGESTQPGTVAVALQAKGNFEIVTNISEIDIGKVNVGDPVHVTLDAFPRTQTWTGKVLSINPAEKVVEGVIFYETRVVFDQEDARLRSGMTANLTIETDRRESVLRVPLRGLKERREKTYVDVLENGAAVEKEIVVGVQNTDHAELVSGVDEGMEVVVGSSATK